VPAAAYQRQRNRVRLRRWRLRRGVVALACRSRSATCRANHTAPIGWRG